ncbi:uncharacterized protein BXZ73DRAFT_82685 [Epithele typhae]|uniref:uncharacterized protein n=1 Tax=Epithele typhae TaxID=378194 RepID=UPI0020077675|nr:uncharacterized protein BXZ73DRAFT_82685 [Epithele typhae]KAH9911615.1 hypothetical protein BXZ73DRAFT_82685 [Epithele typhae]
MPLGPGFFSLLSFSALRLPFAHELCMHVTLSDPVFIPERERRRNLPRVVLGRGRRIGELLVPLARMNIPLEGGGAMSAMGVTDVEADGVPLPVRVPVLVRVESAPLPMVARTSRAPGSAPPGSSAAPHSLEVKTETIRPSCMLADLDASDPYTLENEA